MLFKICSLNFSSCVLIGFLATSLFCANSLQARGVPLTQNALINAHYLVQNFIMEYDVTFDGDFN
jgi:hypothetical protein